MKAVEKIHVWVLLVHCEFVCGSHGFIFLDFVFLIRYLVTFLLVYASFFMASPLLAQNPSISSIIQGSFFQIVVLSYIYPIRKQKVTPLWVKNLSTLL